MKRNEPFEVARKIVEKHFPTCQGALLAGSVVRNEATETSDLDIVIFDSQLEASYRESLKEFGWPIEIFVHNLISYKSFFKSDCERARPSLPQMVSEGIILKDNAFIEDIKKEAKELLDKGPEEWSEEIIKVKRYFITDTLDDFIGCSERAEELFIANALADLLSEFILRTNRKWIGTSKWNVRLLKQYDEKLTGEFVEAFDLFYREGDKVPIIQFVDYTLKPYGGRLFEGFSIGKKKEK
ncbi:MAG: nucleotidyltransferase domain-containing protein [Bacillota bacterium]